MISVLQISGDPHLFSIPIQDLTISNQSIRADIFSNASPDLAGSLFCFCFFGDDWGLCKEGVKTYLMAPMSPP